MNLIIGKTFPPEKNKNKSMTSSSLIAESLQSLGSLPPPTVFLNYILGTDLRPALTPLSI